MESLEPRAMLAVLLNPVVTASFVDVNRDGIADGPSELGFTDLIRETSTRENRAVVEFDLTPIGERVTLAVLDVRLAGLLSGAEVRGFDLVGYAGNGAAELADFNPAGSLIRTVSTWGAQGEGSFRLDVTEEIQALLTGGATHFGLLADSRGDVVQTHLTDVRLSINGLPPLSGTRAWETVPNAIRADGVESFRLEVDLHGDVQAVVLTPWLSQFVTETPGPLTLRDDGGGGDRVAGDFTYTSSELRWNPAQPFPHAFYQDSPDSPPGVAIADLGTVSVTELDGSSSEFLIRPHVGLLRPDLPTAASTTLDAMLQVSDHLINVRSTALATQRTLRGPQIVLDQITKPILSRLPDEFDFFNFFSTQHVELAPRISSPNFVSGRHVPIQFDYSGAGWAPFDNSGDYGSSGRLLGANLLDTLARGISDANATHELVHQWSAYLPTSLGISDGSHYFHHTSVGSLVGGLQWTANGDGSYTINFGEGRNGATHAAPLDLYLMGLIEPAEVPPILVYDPTVQPPKSLANPVVAAGEIIDTVSIDEIVTAAGLRTPGPGTARRDFRIGFVAESHNRLLTPTEMTFYEIFAANYARQLPADQPDPHLDNGWASIARFFGHGSTWTTLLPGRTEAANQPPVTQGADWQIAESAVTGTLVGTAAASDSDAGQSLVYALSEGNADFTFLIDPHTGAITLNRSLDRETKSEYTLTLLVADTGVPSQFDTATITIRLTDANDHPPVITAGQSYSIAENSLAGALVGQVQATDADPGSTLSGFTIVSGNADGAFVIDAASGSLAVADGSRLNHESAATRTLQVRVSDGVHDSALAAVLIEIADVNEPPTAGNRSFSIAEGSVAGAVVGTVTASDEDAGQSLSFGIASGNDGGAFAIDPATGQVTVNNPAALDFETHPSFTLRVDVTDDGTPPLAASATVTILLTDVAELLLDIKPGDATNTINLRNEAKFTVAILSTPSFNAPVQIDVGSLTFGRTGDENSLVRHRKTGAPQYELRDVNGDGLVDLVATFDTSKTALQVGDTLATLKGSLRSGTAFVLTGSVRVINSKR